MTVAQPSTPASYFHLLRWQVHSPLTRPMIVFTPKSLLRAKVSTSLTRDFTEGYFRAVLDDRGITEQRIDPAAIQRVLLCSGKVGYDLMAERDKRERNDVAVLRMERLYPLPRQTLTDMLGRFGDAEVVWVPGRTRQHGPLAVHEPAPARPAGRTDPVRDALPELQPVGRLAAPS